MIAATNAWRLWRGITLEARGSIRVDDSLRAFAWLWAILRPRPRAPDHKSVFLRSAEARTGTENLGLRRGLLSSSAGCGCLISDRRAPNNHRNTSRAVPARRPHYWRCGTARS